MRLIFIPNSSKIKLQRLKANHTHDDIQTKRKQYLSKELKKKVDQLFCSNYNIKPKGILEMLYKQSNTNLPTLAQLSNYLRFLRQKKGCKRRIRRSKAQMQASGQETSTLQVNPSLTAA